MAAEPRYILDADVFITAKNRYYAFDICPGFWTSVIHHHRAGRTYSIDRVRNELLVGRKTEDLVQWVTKDLPDTFFLGVDDDPVTTAYTDVMMWVERSPQYFDYAKAKFATGADGWLVAYARVHDAIVVTNEERRPDAKRERVRRVLHGHLPDAQGSGCAFRVQRVARMTLYMKCPWSRSWWTCCDDAAQQRHAADGASRRR